MEHHWINWRFKCSLIFPLPIKRSLGFRVTFLNSKFTTTKTLKHVLFLNRVLFQLYDVPTSRSFLKYTWPTSISRSDPCFNRSFIQKHGLVQNLRFHMVHPSDSDWLKIWNTGSFWNYDQSFKANRSHLKNQHGVVNIFIALGQRPKRRLNVRTIVGKVELEKFHKETLWKWERPRRNGWKEKLPTRT